LKCVHCVVCCKR